MKKPLLPITAMVLLLLSAGASTCMADVGLVEWGFNLNGTKYLDPSPSSFLPPAPGVLPTSINTAGFDWATGLGTIAITFNPGAIGDYFFVAYFDHEIANGTNGAFNEYGDYSLPPSTSNPDGRNPAPGQSFEIDDPLFGTVFDDFKANTLDNQSHIAQGNPGNVSMAMGFNFHIDDPSVAALITLTMTTTGPPPNPQFYLMQHDDPNDPVSGAAGTNEVLFLSGTISGTSAPSAIPEPGSLLLLGTAIAGLGVVLRRRVRA